MTKWHIVAIIVLATILGTVLWQSPPPILLELSDTALSKQSQYPDAFLVDSKTVQYNEAGHISHILLSDKTHFYEPDKTHPTRRALFTQPHFDFYDEQSSSEQHPISWQASSDTAKSLNGEEELLMMGNVSLIQQPKTGIIPTTINTEELLIKPNQQYAETDKPVIIKSESGVITSTGLTLSLDTDTMVLLSNVRSRYEPR